MLSRLGRFLFAHPLDNPFAEQGMTLHLVKFFGRELAGLQQDLVRDSHFSHIMQLSGLLEHSHGLFIEA